jgi:hypothetical protein
VTAPAPLATAEVLRQVRRLELRTRRVVDTRFAGEYRSVFKGQGLEFAEVREYQPGDEVRAIDWHVTARMGRPFVKRFEEERELTVLFVVDVSASTGFGTGVRTKLDVARELVAVLALTAARHNDRVGLLLCTDRVERVVPPRKGRRQALRLLRELLMATPLPRGTALAPVADTLARLLPHRAVLFLVGDGIEPADERGLARLAQRHDVVAVTVQDPAERELPDVGPALLQDPETGATAVVDTSHPAVRAQFARQRAASDAARERLLARLGVDEVRLEVGHGILSALQGLFRSRLRRRRGAVRVASRSVASPPPTRTARAMGLPLLLVAALAWPVGAVRAGGQPATAPAPMPAPAAQPAAPSSPAPGGTAGALRPSVRVRPETVTVGDPFVVDITVPLPAGRVVRWPSSGDSSATVAPSGPVTASVRPRAFGGRVEVAQLPLAAWDTGTVRLPLGAVEVEVDGKRLAIPLPLTTVRVRSVLPLDTAQHRPTPPRAPFPRLLPWWEEWGAALAVAGALGLLGWWVRRRRRHAPQVASPARSPLETAQAAFRQLDAWALAESGEGAQHAAAALDIVRRYLAATVPGVSIAHTSAELLAALAGTPEVPAGRLVSLLAEGDRARFAPQAVARLQARAVAQEARAVVEAVDEALQRRAPGEDARAGDAPAPGRSAAEGR